MDFIKGFTLVSEDGVFVRFEETPEKDRVILSLTRGLRVETASLNKEMVEAIGSVDYKLDVHYSTQKVSDDSPPPADPPPQEGG